VVSLARQDFKVRFKLIYTATHPTVRNHFEKRDIETLYLW
jgi:hypothetical protein